MTPSDDADVQTLSLSTACLGVLHNRGIKTVGELRALAAKEHGLRRLPGIGPTFEHQIIAALDGRPIAGATMSHTPAQLRALAAITEATGRPSSSWRVVHQPPDMTWVDYVDGDGNIGQCCRDGDGWRKAPETESPVFLMFIQTAVRR